MQTRDYPDLFGAADAASLRAQKWYRWLAIASLVLAVTAAGAASVAGFDSGRSRDVLAVVAAAALVAALMGSFTQRFRDDQQVAIHGAALTATRPHPCGIAVVQPMIKP